MPGRTQTLGNNERPRVVDSQCLGRQAIGALEAQATTGLVDGEDTSGGATDRSVEAGPELDLGGAVRQAELLPAGPAGDEIAINGSLARRADADAVPGVAIDVGVAAE